MTLGRQVTREAAIYAVGIVAAAAFQFLAVPVFTRAFGPTQYSYLALTLAVTSALGGILILGGDVTLSRFWFDSGDVQARRDLALTWIAFLTCWSLVVVVLVACFSSQIAGWLGEDPAFQRLLLVGLAILVPAQLSRMLAQVLRNSFRPIAFAATSIVIGALGLGFGVTIGVVLNHGVIGALWGTLVAETLGCLVRFPMVRRDLRGRMHLRTLRGPLRFGIPFVPASVASWVFTGADRIMVGRDLGATALGHYAAAATLVVPFSLLLIAVGQAWVPRIMQQHERSAAAAARAIATSVELSVLVFGGAAVVLAAVAPALVRLVAGEEFVAGAQALPLLALGSMFLGTSLFVSTGFTLAKKTAAYPVVAVLAAVANVVLLVVLVPGGALVGAAIAVAISYAGLSLGLLWISQTTFPAPLPYLRLASLVAVVAAVCIVATLRPETLLLLATAAAGLVVLGCDGWVVRRHLASGRTT